MSNSGWTPPIIKPRKPGWDAAMISVLEEHLAQPHTWGISDCLIVPADICRAMTGSNPFPNRMRRYRTESGALKLLLKLGFRDVEDALKAAFPTRPLAQARRGDCGVVEGWIDGRSVLSTVIIIGGGKAIGRDLNNQRITVPALSLRSAFEVG